jgi:C1A family cysteine protease
MTESDYPYTSGTTGTWESCAYDASEGVTNVSSYAAVTPSDLDAMYAAIAQQPVSVAIEADTTYFQTYVSGVLTDAASCGVSLDHAVLAVGYGTDSDGVAYFLVKNSWNTTWGDEGYVKIGAVEGDGVCGINMNSYTVAV